MPIHKENGLNEMPNLSELISEFSEKAKKENLCWIAKYTRIIFEYEGKEYEIIADDLKVHDEQFECVQSEMIERLKQLGANNLIKTILPHFRVWEGFSFLY